MLQTILATLAEGGAPVSVKVKEEPDLTLPTDTNGSGGGARRTRRGTNAGTTIQPVQAAPPAEDLAGADEPAAEGEDEMFGLPTTGQGRTGEEARQLALTGARNLFNAGHKGAVKEIQAIFNVGKFSDIPPSEGHKLLRLVEAAAQKVGMRV
jgi:hypothetical protein